MYDIVRSIYTAQTLYAIGLVDVPPNAATIDYKSQEIVAALEKQKRHQVGEVVAAYQAIDGAILYANREKFSCNHHYKGHGYAEGTGDQSLMACKHFMHVESILYLMGSELEGWREEVHQQLGLTSHDSLVD